MTTPRQAVAEQAVLRALDALRPGHCGPLNIVRLAGLRWMRGALALARLTDAGVIEQVRSPVDPSRVVYRRVRSSSTPSDQ